MGKAGGNVGGMKPPFAKGKSVGIGEIAGYKSGVQANLTRYGLQIKQWVTVLVRVHPCLAFIYR